MNTQQINQNQNTSVVFVENQPGEILSPSQVRTFMDCSARWEFRYVDRLPEVANSNLALGKAVHSAILQSMADKVTTEKDLKTSDVIEHYHEEFSREISEAALRPDESKDDIRNMGASLVRLYMEEEAPNVQPLAVEMKVDGLIGGVQVNGYIDLVEESGTIRDLKTAAKTPSGETLDHNQRLQLATYALLSPLTNGLIQIDTMVKLKTPKLIVGKPQGVTPHDIAYAETVYPLAQRAMRAGVAVPNRGSMLCSRKNCSFVDACVSRFGGEVKD